jgi:hypothetical protein
LPLVGTAAMDEQGQTAPIPAARDEQAAAPPVDLTP